jgi:hypothetical protein
MFRKISGIGLVGAVVLTAGVALGSLSTPCPTEDSTWCTWYADVQGNGTGYSFTAVTDSFAVKH